MNACYVVYVNNITLQHYRRQLCRNQGIWGCLVSSQLSAAEKTGGGIANGGVKGGGGGYREKGGGGRSGNLQNSSNLRRENGGLTM